MRPLNTSFISQFRFGASVDFVTIGTPSKRDLPPLTGAPKWGIAAHYQTLTVHDLAARDVRKLASVYYRAPVLALEVAVDLRPNSAVAPADRAALLDEAHGFMVRHLYPYDAPKMRGAKTLAYTPDIQKTLPFNFKMPQPTAQLLYGLRDDGPVQVKVYRKGRDNGASLNERDHSTRVEVRLKREMCQELGIDTIEDLTGFAFRTKLAAYFRMVRTAAPTKRRSQRSTVALVEDRKAENALDLVQTAWLVEGTGVQGLLEVPGLRFMRHIEANQRIGTGLQLLQRRFASCDDLDSTAEHDAAQAAQSNEESDWIDGPRITTTTSGSVPTPDTARKDPIDALEELVS